MAVTHSLALSEIGNDGIWSYASEATTLGTGATDVESGTVAGEPKTAQVVI